MCRFFLMLLVLALSCVLLCCNRKNIPVYPGAVGFGTETPAGRGGQIIHVTNLNAEGSGSFAAAVQTPTPRIVVFDVGGGIKISKNIEIVQPFLTIAGQTAPAPGITLMGGGLEIKTHDILLQHLRIRVGDDLNGPSPSSRDAIKILGKGASNVVIDHVSMSWAVDENISTWSGPSNITISNSIISEGLSKSIHPDGEHSKGFLVGPGTRKLSIIGNLFAHNKTRNPLIYGNTSVLILNNIFYNAGSASFVSISDGWHSGPSEVSIVGNRFISGPSSAGNLAVKLEKDCANDTKVYFLDNTLSAGNLLTNKSADRYKVVSPPVWDASLSTVESWPPVSRVLFTAGARNGGVDEIDRRIIRDVEVGSGRIINSQTDVGGWLKQEMTIRKFEVPQDPNGDSDGDGYTNIEEVLHHYADL